MPIETVEDVTEGQRRGKALVTVFTQGSPSNNLLRFGLAILAIFVSAVAARNMIGGYPFAADIEIPLRAASRWLAGQPPYLPEAFKEGPGYELPFLYPPFLLPMLAPFAIAPRVIVDGAWLVICLAVAALTCLRMGVGGWRTPLVLMWPPFFEALAGGNVQIVVFAAYVWLLFEPSMTSLDPRRDGRRLVVRATFAALTFLVKVSQIAPLVLVMRRRPQTAIAAIAIGLVIVGLTLPLTGLSIWVDWLQQARRAADPGWSMAGLGLTHYFPSPLAIGLAVASIAAVLIVPIGRGGEWAGVLTVLGAVSLHTFGLLFLIPALIRIRRELALIAALFIATYTEPGWWVGIGIAAVGLLLAERFSWIRERPGTETDAYRSNPLVHLSDRPEESTVSL